MQICGKAVGTASSRITQLPPIKSNFVPNQSIWLGTACKSYSWNILTLNHRDSHCTHCKSKHFTGCRGKIESRKIKTKKWFTKMTKNKKTTSRVSMDNVMDLASRSCPSILIVVSAICLTSLGESLPGHRSMYASSRQGRFAVKENGKSVSWNLNEVSRGAETLISQISERWDNSNLLSWGQVISSHNGPPKLLNTKVSKLGQFLIVQAMKLLKPTLTPSRCRVFTAGKHNGWSRDTSQKSSTNLSTFSDSQ